VSPGGLQQSSRGSFISAASELAASFAAATPFAIIAEVRSNSSTCHPPLQASQSKGGIAPVTIVAAIIVLWIISLASLAVTLPPDFWADDAK
jgi:hypothetical protein